MMARSAASASLSAPASLAEKPRSMTSLSPCPTASVQPAATSSATPAIAKRPRYGRRKLLSRPKLRSVGGREAVSGSEAMRRGHRPPAHYRLRYWHGRDTARLASLRCADSDPDLRVLVRAWHGQLAGRRRTRWPRGRERAVQGRRRRNR